MIHELNSATQERTEDARSKLMAIVRQLPMNTHFTRSTLKAAEGFVWPPENWRPPLAWFRPDGSGADALQCEVADTPGTYQLVTVFLYPLFGEIALESRCSCEKTKCPHAAALLLRLQQALDWPRAMTPLERWQQSIEDVQAPARPSRLLARRTTRRLVCLLQPQSERRPAAMVARLVSLGREEELQQGRWLPFEDALDCTELSTQAMLWQARLTLGRPRVESSETGYLLEGQGGAALLAEFFRAGICHHAHTLQRIHAGALRRVQWEWSFDSFAQARLVLRSLEDPAVRLIELDGLRYFDEASGEFGELDLSTALFDLLKHMPPIPPGETALRSTWPWHPLLAGIPPPPPAPVLRNIDASLSPILVLSASRDPENDNYIFHLRAWSDYAGCRLPLALEPWRQKVIRRIRGEYVTVTRDIDLELSSWQALVAADIIELSKLLPYEVQKLLPASDAPPLAHRQHCRGGPETLAALDAIARSLDRSGFRLEYDSELPFAVLSPQTQLQARLDVDEKAGWTQFEFAAMVDGGEFDMLPIILEGLAKKAFSLIPTSAEVPNACWLAPLGPKRFIPLPLSQLREWLGPLIEWVDKPKSNRSPRVALSRAQAMALSECLRRQGVTVTGVQALNIADTLAALRAAQRSSSFAKTSTSFRGTLRGYQSEGLQWLQTLRQSELGGVLADDMGLGKTVQIIAHLLLEMESGRLDRPALIVAPTSLIFNWMDEMARFAPSLRCVNYAGPERTAQRDKLVRAHAIVISYALLVKELPTLAAIDYSMLVLDEAQWIKNPLTQTARAVRDLRASHRLVVTGTPLENHLGELWAHMDAVMPGYLGDYRSFNRSFREPIERHGDDLRLAILRERISPFLLRRSKAAVAPELPPKIETVLRVAMADPQRRLYESLRLAMSDRVRAALGSYSNEQSRIVVLSALLRLRQVCCDPRLLSETAAPQSSSAKLDTLLDLVRSLLLEGRQILIFSQFTSMLDLISEALRAAHFSHVTLTGKTTDRAAPVRSFQRKSVPILLASLKAGGVGLNLTAADAVIHYDPWWNPAVELQAVDRAHRLGREQPVFVYKLLCSDTIEETIEAMKDRKSDLAHAAMGDQHSASRGFTEIDIRALFDLTSAQRR